MKVLANTRDDVVSQYCLLQTEIACHVCAKLKGNQKVIAELPLHLALSFGPGSDYKGNPFLGDAVQYYYLLSPVTAIKLLTCHWAVFIMLSPLLFSLCLGWCEQPGSESMHCHNWMNKKWHHTLSMSFLTKKPTVTPSVSLRLPDIATIR